jgi:pentafunctional AROM polypeptide
MRGVPVVHVPTTLLAMVDASIGGKTGVNTPHGKNLIGAFHQPRCVYLDIAYLMSLPRRQLVNGFAEVIKMAAILDISFFSWLEDSNRIVGLLDERRPDLLYETICRSVKLKIQVILEDEFETTGRRSLLNFGHTVGHAIEILDKSRWLHGEAVSLGMIKELEIARHLGLVNSMEVARLCRCLKQYGLPVLYPSKTLPLDQMLKTMAIDKKTDRQGFKNIVLLSRLGECIGGKAQPVSDSVVQVILSREVEIVSVDFSTLSKSSIVRWRVPGSKSISNRALILAALGQGSCSLTGFLHSDDTAVCIEALRQMGCSIRLETPSCRSSQSSELFQVSSQDQLETTSDEWIQIEGTSGRLIMPSQPLYLGNAGTAARFLTTVCTLISEATDRKEVIHPSAPTITLTGDARMKERPIHDLVETLTQAGCAIRYVGDHPGCLPIQIDVSKSTWQGGPLELNATTSSQFVSSLLLSAPYAREPVQLTLIGDEIVSKSFIDLTISMMASFGVVVEQQSASNFRIPRGIYQNPAVYKIEGDASSATYTLALAAITGATVFIENVGSISLQGDAAFCWLLHEMGCQVFQTSTATQVTGPPSYSRRSPIHDVDPSPDASQVSRLKAIDVDMGSMTDAFMTAAVVMAIASGTSRIRRVTNQRVKECNRIAVMAEHLLACGVFTEETEDGLIIHGVGGAEHLKAARIECHNDHRIAMSFALLGCVCPGVVIDDKNCVEKTYPEFWDHLHRHFGVVLRPPISHVRQPNRDRPLESGKLHSWILVGMRGAGKSRLAKALAVHKQWSFFDMDVVFEDRHQCSISSFVNQFGWDAFRNRETDLLTEVLTYHPTRAVIACGGGVVENVRARSLLSTQDGVVAVWKPLEDLIWALEHDQDDHDMAENTMTKFNNEISLLTRRAVLPDSLSVTLKRRLPYYLQLASFCFPIARGERDWNRVTREWIAFIERLENDGDPIVALSKFDPPKSNTYGSTMLSLTLKDLHTISDNSWSCMTAGVQAIELRADLLSSHEQADMMDHLARLRRLQHDYQVFTVFTLRTQSQGGRFQIGDTLSNESATECIANLMKLASSTGVSFLDVEHEWPPHLIETIVENAWPARILLSYHNFQGKDILQSYVERFKIMSAQSYASIIKLIRYAHSPIDALSFWSTVNCEERLPHFSSRPRSLVLAMGEHGRMTRALQHFLSPVTHPQLPYAAAPGQMSLRELNQLRVAMGLLRPRYFYLFGSPIGRSMSPTIHSIFFRYFGLPHVYKLFECTEVTEDIRQLIDSPDFGGASVTMPLKERIMPVLSQIDPSDLPVGSVNTIVIDRTSSSSQDKTYNYRHRLIGHNTDWRAIHRILAEQMPSERRGGSALVMGAGGSARAACHALRQWQGNLDRLYIFNRTLTKAQSLAEAFDGIALDSWDSLSDELELGVIVTTLPAEAQEEIADLLPSRIWHTRPLLIEMVYRPMRTRFFQLAERHQSPVCPGIRVLYYQAILQFQLWTGLRVPDNELAEQVFEDYQTQEISISPLTTEQIVTT